MTYFPETNSSKIDTQQNQIVESTEPMGKSRIDELIYSTLFDKIKNFQTWIHPDCYMNFKGDYKLSNNKIEFLSNEPSVIFNVDKNSRYTVRDTRNGTQLTIFKYDINFLNGVENFNSIEIHTCDNQVKLSNVLSLPLLELLKQKRIKSFGCVDLVNSVFGKFKELHFFNSNDWDLKPDDSNYTIGDAVGLSKVKNPKDEIFTLDFVHFAINVGNDLFLSLYGGESAFIFSTMEEMKNFYNAATVLKMHPH